MSCGAPHPIPLTEEILLKCGFVRHFTGFQEDNVMRLNIKNEEMAFDFLGVDYDLNRKVLSILQDSDIIHLEHIEHLHQIQNGVQFLTGEELNVEL